jgi:hypothetical protein
MKILDTANAAIMRQTSLLAESAARVAKVGDPEAGGADVDLPAEAVNRIDAERAIEANLAVIKEEDERTKHLLDIIA